MKNDGVPVLDSVAAIFAPMCPLLPTPVIITLPWQLYISSTALSRFSSIKGMRSSSASASSLIHLIAYSLVVIIKSFIVSLVTLKAAPYPN